MVHIVKHWDTFVDNTEHVRRGFYIEKPDIDDMVEIRIVAGRVGYRRSFSKDDPFLNETIRPLLKIRGFTEIETSIDPDIFLR